MTIAAGLFGLMTGLVVGVFVERLFVKIDAELAKAERDFERQSVRSITAAGREYLAIADEEWNEWCVRSIERSGGI